jgi:serine/threonine-protein kinase
MKEPIQPPSTVRADVPREFDAIIDQALSRNPDARFQTAREFGRALREALAGSGTAIDGPTVEEWLEALFPGDRVKRQQLSATVRSAGPDALLETVPSALKISDTSTGSKRNFKSQSGGRAASSSQRLPQVGSQPGRTGSQSGRTGSQSGRQSGRTGSQSGRTGSQSGRNPLTPSGVEGTLTPIAVEPSPPLTPSEVEGPAPSSSKGLVLGLIALVIVVVAGAAFVVLRAPSEPEPIAAIDVSPSPRGGEGKHEAPPVPEPEPVEPVIVDAGATPAPATVVDAGSAIAVAPQREVIDAGSPTVVAAVKTPRQPKPTPPPARVEPPKPPKPVAAAAPVKAIPGGGQVRFKTPGGVADVYIDGVKAGVTPVILQLSAGKHSFELKVDGFEFGGPKSITVAPAGDYNIEVDLR